MAEDEKIRQQYIDFDEYIRQGEPEKKVTIKYLRSLGFIVNNDMFERHSWYFRNALVRANYQCFESLP